MRRCARPRPAPSISAGTRRGAARWARAAGLTMALALAMVSAADAQWVWRDRDGQVNASDRPPPREVPEKDILTRPTSEQRRPAVAAGAPAPASPAASGAAATPLDRELQARKRAAEAEQAARARADEERASVQRAENCRAARSQLAALDSGQRVARINGKGEREFVDDAERAAEARRTREIIASECR